MGGGGGIGGGEKAVGREKGRKKHGGEDRQQDGQNGKESLTKLYRVQGKAGKYTVKKAFLF
jgi:hypothetical protein